jgi:hypothetical protein
MTASTVQLTIPYELLVETISGLQVEQKVTLHQLLGLQIAREQVRPHPLPYEQRKAALDTLDRTVDRILEETGITENELVEALAPRKASHSL